MISDPLSIHSKHQKHSFVQEKFSKFSREFLSNHKIVKDCQAMYSSQTNQRIDLKKPPLKKSTNPLSTNKSMIEGIPRLNQKTYKLNTPSNSIQIFDSKKFLNFTSKHNRPISVGGKNIRPAFLEPEVISHHYPNKSALITPSRHLNEIEGFKEPYKFPLFRTKRISGFKLSASPEPITDEGLKEKIQKATNIIANDILNISKTQRAPLGNSAKAKDFDETYKPKTSDFVKIYEMSNSGKTNQND